MCIYGSPVFVDSFVGARRPGIVFSWQIPPFRVTFDPWFRLFAFREHHSRNRQGCVVACRIVDAQERLQVIADLNRMTGRTSVCSAVVLGDDVTDHDESVVEEFGKWRIMPLASNPLPYKRIYG